MSDNGSLGVSGGGGGGGVKAVSLTNLVAN